MCLSFCWTQRTYILEDVFKCLCSLSLSDPRVQRSASSNRNRLTEDALQTALEPLIELQRDTNIVMKSLQRNVVHLTQRLEIQQEGFLNQNRDWIILAVILLFQVILQWLLR